MKRSQNAKLLKLFVFLIFLPLLLTALYQAQKYLTRAVGIKANLVVDKAFELETITNKWQSYSQGGEESADMIAPVVDQTRLLKPRFIRIDHIFDHFGVVGRNSIGQLTFDFSLLDQMISSILKTGATPFFSLSYMPPVLTSSGNILDMPSRLDEWAYVVQKTIEHYSGTSQMNLNNVYYEVWNEPDLFGKFSYYGSKNYLSIYTYATVGAKNARDVNQFKIGGPATTSLYKNWILALVEHVNKFQLRLDFISWHRYNTDPAIYSKDITDVARWLFYYPDYLSKPKLITEWGFNSEIASGYDTSLSAAHTIATARNTLTGYEQLFAFELVDGPNKENSAFWGRWGILTYPQPTVIKKPRYYALNMLNQISGTRLLVTGEGTWVKAIASYINDEVHLLVTNYDPDNRNTEYVPITINNIENGDYILTRQDLSGKIVSQDINISNGTYQTNQIMPQNSVFLFTLKRS